MTTVIPRQCYSLFSDDNKFSLSKLNGNEPLAVTAFILEPVPAVAIMDDSDEESSDEESSDEESSDEEYEISELTQIVTCVDREQLLPDEEEDSDENLDDEVILLENVENNVEDNVAAAAAISAAAVSEERMEVAAALASISEYEDEKFTELAEQLKKAKLLKNAGLIDDAHVQVELGWTRMNLYIR
jgi:hypothetical protein